MITTIPGVITAALSELNASNGRGSLRATNNTQQLAWGTHLPETTRQTLNTYALSHGGYQQVIYSYETPIAVKIEDHWLAPDVTYSMTTSHHQAHLYMLPNLYWVPADVNDYEVDSIINGYIFYNRVTKQYTRGHMTRP